MDELPGRELPPDPDGACFACGPRHPAGLRMRFFDDGHRTRSRLLLDDAFCGLRGRVADGVTFLALDEAVAWCAWARFGRRAVGDRDSHFVVLDPPRTRVPFFVEAWRVGVPEPEGWWRFQAVARQAGDVKARLSNRMRAGTREDLAAWAADPDLPPSLRQEAAEALARLDGGGQRA